jgi:hypothetical protein
VFSQFIDGGIAFALVACRRYENEGLVLRTRVQEFVDEATPNGKAEAATAG